MPEELPGNVVVGVFVSSSVVVGDCPPPLVVTPSTVVSSDVVMAFNKGNVCSCQCETDRKLELYVVDTRKRVWRLDYLIFFHKCYKYIDKSANQHGL